MKVKPTLLFFFSSLGLFSQSNFTQFKKLSRPEKCWTFTHPLIAKKAFTITKTVLADVDSLKKTGTFGTDLNGGKLDALKHSYWMAYLTVEIGRKKALRLGCAHEKGNRLEFKKHKLEDSILPDSVSSAMDFHNNLKGANAVTHCEHIGKSEVQKRITALLSSGELIIIKKDKQGNYLYCDGTFIDMNQWKGKWNIPKCLVPSSTN
jgi:hypothetical protein